MTGMRGCATAVAALACLAFLGGAALAVPTTYFEPASEEVGVYETCELSVVVNGEILGVTGYDLLIEYDAMVVEPVAVTQGDLHDGYGGETFLYWDIDDQNRLLINGAFLGGTVDGPGALVIIEFMGLADGTSPVDFGDCELRDLENAGISTDWVGATIDVMGAVPAEARTWTAVKALFR